MTLEQVRIFLCVAALSHVTQAARRLNLTQSAVSAAISALERQYDVRLFDRVGRGILLTENGKLLVPAALRIQREADSARALLSNISDEPRGRLRLWASQTIASYWIVPYMIRMHQTWPQVDMFLHAGNTAEVTNAVTEGAADIGLIEGDIMSSGLTTQVVARDELLLVLSRDHPIARQPSFSALDYCSMQWLLREPGSGTRTVTEQHLADMGLSVSELSVFLQLPTNEAILAGIRSGEFASLLSWRSVISLRARDLALRRITWAPKPRRFFFALTDPRRARTSAVDKFLTAI
ncbi:MAG: LysR substrate-binding domain-containing protein [Hyphomicrobiaceae bacterium]